MGKPLSLPLLYHKPLDNPGVLSYNNPEAKMRTKIYNGPNYVTPEEGKARKPQSRSQVNHFPHNPPRQPWVIDGVEIPRTKKARRLHNA